MAIEYGEWRTEGEAASSQLLILPFQVSIQFRQDQVRITFDLWCLSSTV